MSYMIRRFIADESGLETVEYAIVGGLITIGSIVTIGALGAMVAERLEDLRAKLATSVN